MKTIKLKPGMPLNVQFITKDRGKNGLCCAWKYKPINDDGIWIGGNLQAVVHMGKLLKPEEIAKVVK